MGSVSKRFGMLDATKSPKQSSDNSSERESNICHGGNRSYS